MDMRLGPITKQKNLTMTSCWKIKRHCHISNLWSIWSNPKAKLQAHSL